MAAVVVQVGHQVKPHYKHLRAHGCILLTLIWYNLRCLIA
jgi:hypothetical protein